MEQLPVLKHTSGKPEILSGRRPQWIKIAALGTSLAVQWLRLHAPNAGDTGLIPGRGTKMPHAAWRSQKKKKAALHGSQCSERVISVTRGEKHRLPLRGCHFTQF